MRDIKKSPTLFRSLTVWIAFSFFLTGFQCQPYSYTEVIHVYFHPDGTFRVLATLETNGYMPEWSAPAQKVIREFQQKQDSLMRSSWADKIIWKKGQWNDQIQIFAVEANYHHEYGLMKYLQPDNEWWDFFIGQNDSINKVTFNLMTYRKELAKYAWCYQRISKKIIDAQKITYTSAGIDSFYVTSILPLLPKNNSEMQDIGRQVTWGILSENERVMIPFSNTLFSLQKYRFHASGMTYELSSDFLFKDVDGSLVYFKYPEFSKEVLSFAVYSPFRRNYTLQEIEQAINSEIPEFISFKWKKFPSVSWNPRADSVSIIPLSPVNY